MPFSLATVVVAIVRVSEWSDIRPSRRLRAPPSVLREKRLRATVPTKLLGLYTGFGGDSMKSTVSWPGLRRQYLML